MSSRRVEIDSDDEDYAGEVEFVSPSTLTPNQPNVQLYPIHDGVDAEIDPSLRTEMYSSKDVGDEENDFDDPEEWDEEDNDFDWIESWEEAHLDHSHHYSTASLGLGPNAQRGMSSANAFQPVTHKLSGLEKRLYLDPIESNATLNQRILSDIKGFEKKDLDMRIRHTDKSDRATQELVLDPRTKLILFKLLDKNFFRQINGCVSTGKEANVYHAFGEFPHLEYAVKIYKTSILVFKDRDRYVQGDYRFRRGFQKSNPRRMVRMWAEKEARNLNRLRLHGVPCPEFVVMKQHVLIMSFIGENGYAAPRLKDAHIEEEDLDRLYWKTMELVRRIYQRCRLVHGDLSEYNMLLWKNEVYIIDVSQSVEHDHPHALEFLRKDLINTTEFFRRRGLEKTMLLREAFEFVTDISISENEIPDVIAQKRESVQHQHSLTAEEEIDEAVFSKIHIPRTLAEVNDCERDLELARDGHFSDLVYASVTGLDPDSMKSLSTRANEHLSSRFRRAALFSDMKESDSTFSSSRTPNLSPEKEGANSADMDSKDGFSSQDSEEDDGDGVSSDASDSSSSSDDDENSRDGNPARRKKTLDMPEELLSLSKAERKKVVKQLKRDKRADKTPKHVKKRHQKNAKSRRGKR